MVIGAPSDENQCRQMLQSAWLHDGPAAVRYPRGEGVGVAVDSELSTIEIGKAMSSERRRRGHSELWGAA